MSRFQYKLMQFMSGRYGMDLMGRDLLIFGCLLLALDIFIPGSVVRYIAFAVLIYTYFRIMSRNIPKRQAEQTWYMARIGASLHSFTQRDHEHYRYFRCPNCHQTLRAPKGRGRIRITCSRCGNKFEKKV